MKHTTTYLLCKKLIAAGKTDRLKQLIDLYVAAVHITEEEFVALAGELAPENEEAADGE